MVYIATEDIGGYKAGQEVPAEKVRVWSQMYLTVPVKSVEGGVEAPVKAAPVASSKGKVR